MRKSENQQWTVSEITLVKNDEWDGTNVGNSDLVISTQNCSRDVGKIVNINKNNSEITAQVEGEHMTEELKFPVTMLDFQAVNGDLVILGNFIFFWSAGCFDLILSDRKPFSSRTTSIILVKIFSCNYQLS